MSVTYAIRATDPQTGLTWLPPARQEVLREMLESELEDGEHG